MKQSKFIGETLTGSIGHNAEIVENLIDALQEMLEAYAPRADWSQPEKLHSAVLKAGSTLEKAGVPIKINHHE